MRVTQNILFTSLRNHLMNNSEKLLQAQEIVATQKKFNRLSDNPVDGGRVLDLNNAVSHSKQYLSNIDRASSATTVQDSTLSQANTLLGRAKKLLLQEANQASSTATTREAARIEISTLTSQMVQVGNARFDGKYIFSGYATSTPAFADAGGNSLPGAGNTGGSAITSQRVADATKMTYDNYQIQFTAANQFNIIDTTSGATLASNQAYSSGGAILFNGVEIKISNNPGAPAAGDSFTVNTVQPGAYQGDGQIQNVEVQPGTLVPQNIPGNRAFKGAGLAGGVDMFSIMNQINSALRSNDRTALSSLVDKLDAAQTQISNERAAVGGRTNMLTMVKDRQTDVQSRLEMMQSNLEDIDVTEAITNLSKQQDTYNATLAASAKIVQMSLLDFLR